MTPRRNILMFAPLCYPPACSESIATAKLVLAMLNAGWGITVITQSDFGQYYSYRPTGLLSIVKSVAVSIPEPASGKSPASRRRPEGSTARTIKTAGWVARAAAQGFRALGRGRYTHLMSRAAPQYGHLPAWIVRRRARVPWVANWSDPMPPERAPAPYGRGPAAPPPRIAGLYCDAIAGTADWHTFPCERLMNYFVKLYPGISNKASVVPHVALQGHFPAVAAGPGFSLCHCGSISQRNPGVFMAGVRLFLQGFAGGGAVKLLFVTDQEREVRAAADCHGLGRLTEVITGAGYEESLAVAATATVLVVLEAPVDEGVFFPSKFADYVQAGKPILAVSPARGTLRDILEHNGGGLAVDCRSPAAVRDALGVLYETWMAGCLGRFYGSSHLLGLFGEGAVIGCCDQALDRAAAHET